MPAILKEGRTTYSEAPDFVNEMEEAEREQWEKDRARKDPLEYRLKALSDDKRKWEGDSNVGGYSLKTEKLGIDIE